MENLGHNSSKLMWYNTRLFHSNGTPFKFYLEGYSHMQSHKMSKIIEVYGGKLSDPDDSDTFVFCSPVYPLGTGECDRYNINYFRDSIRAFQLQDLMTDKLQEMKDPYISTSVNDNGLIQVDHEEEDYVFSPLTISDEDESGDDNQSPPMESQRDESNEQRAKNDRFQETTEDKSWIDCIFASDIEYENVDLFASDLNESSDSDDSCPSGERSIHPFVTASSSDVDRLNENERTCSSTNAQIHDRMNDDNADGIHDYSFQNSSEDQGDCYSSDAHQTTDDCDPPFRSTAENNKRPRLPMPTFTEEDNQIMIKWLMENNYIPTDAGIKIWKIFVNEKVLPNPEITFCHLRSHFSTLKKHPTFKKYIEEWKISEHIPVPKCRSKIQYTRKENQFMMKYLIVNKLINRAHQKQVWEECLKKHRKSLHLTRTAEGLRSYFRKTLSKKYMRYSHDPEVLRKFRNIQARKDNNQRNRS